MPLVFVSVFSDKSTRYAITSMYIVMTNRFSHDGSITLLNYKRSNLTFNWLLISLVFLNLLAIQNEI